jgi:hypothetical protein
LSQKRRWILLLASCAVLAIIAGAPRVASAYKQWQHDRRLSMIERAKKAVASGTDSIPPELAALQDDDAAPDGPNGPDGPDDAVVRQLATAVELGPRTPEAMAQQARIAAEEAAKWGSPDANASALAAGASLPGTRPWYSLGPQGARSQYNGTYYTAQDSGRPTYIRLDPNNQNTLYVAVSGGGLWRATNFNFDQPTWMPLTETLGALSVSGFDVDPSTPGTLYVGLGDPFDQQIGAVSKSIDGGKTWAALNFLQTAAHPADGFPSFAQNVRDLRVDPTNPLSIFVATDDGFYHSIDGGQTYAMVDLPNTPAYGSTREGTWSIVYLGQVAGAAAPQSAWLVAGVYACPGFTPPGRGGNTSACPSPSTLPGNLGDIWKSVDSGQTWTSARAAGLLPVSVTGTTANDIGRISLGAGAPTAGGATTTIYAQCANLTDAASKTNAYLKSTDGGASWTQIATSTTAVTNPTIIGTDCTNMNNGHGQSWYNLSVGVDPGNPNRAIFGGNLCGIRTVDGGATFNLVSHWLPSSGQGTTARDALGQPINVLPYVHADWHTTTVYTQNGLPLVLVGSDGGLFASTDVFDNPVPEKVTWTQPNIGLVTHLLYSVASGDPSLGNAGTVFTGLQDNGTRLRLIDDENDIADVNLQVWDQIIGGDGIGSTIASDFRGGNMVYWSALPGTSRPLCIPRLHDCSKATRIENGAEISNWPRFANSLTAGGSSGDSEPFFVRYSPVQDGTNAVLTASTFAAWKVTANTLTNVPTYQRLTPAVTVSPATGGIQVEGTLRSIRGNGPVASPFQYSVNGAPARIYGLPLSSGSTGGGAAVIVDTGATVSMLPAVKGINVPNPTAGGAATLFIGNTFSMAFPRNPASLGGTDPTKTYLVSSTGALTNAVAGSPSVLIPPSVGHLFMTNDGGTTWHPFVGNGTGFDLPNIGIYIIKYDPSDTTDNTLWAATELGVYRSTDAGNTWARYGLTPSYDASGNLIAGGLPLVRVWDLFLSTNGSLVRAATYGRGMWEIYPNSEPPTVAGKGDFDRNGVIDYFDMSHLAARMGTDPNTSAGVPAFNPSSLNPRYDSALDLDITPSTLPDGGVGPSTISETDLTALTAKFGSAP